MRWTRILFVAVLLAFAGCGDGGSSGDATRSSADGTSSTTVTTTPGISNAALDDLPPLLEPVGGVSLGGFSAGGMLIDRLHVPAGGLDLTPFFPEGWCPVAHWGAVLEGAVHVRYADGAEEVYSAGTTYFMRPAHTVWFDGATTLLEVSPEREMRELISHVNAAVSNMVATTTTTVP